mmetsp:Transcript_55112/g.131330  ORF Transcript_55112/g.131330 Transcript_55112/m.131330 type:complete len:256 (+) Transcript_55112:836-1603(+)
MRQSRLPDSTTKRKSPASPCLITTSSDSALTSFMAPMTAARSWSSRLENMKDLESTSLSRSFCASDFWTTGATNFCFLFHSPYASAETLARAFMPAASSRKKPGGGSSSESSSSSSSSSCSASSPSLVSCSSTTNFAAVHIWDFTFFICSSNPAFSSSISSFSCAESSSSSSLMRFSSKNFSMKGTGSSGVARMHSRTIASRRGFSSSTMYFFFSSDTFIASKLSIASYHLWCASSQKLRSPLITTCLGSDGSRR